MYCVNIYTQILLIFLHFDFSTILPEQVLFKLLVKCLSGYTKIKIIFNSTFTICITFSKKLGGGGCNLECEPSKATGFELKF